MKPIKRSELLEVIRSAKGRPRKELDVQAPSAQTSGEQRPIRILLVEDSEDNRLLIQAYLKTLPHALDIAENGEIAVLKFQNGRYDVVLMDMQMPVMDGYTATRTIRAWEQEKQRTMTPIIALTAYALKDDERKSIEAGCSAHLTKPIKKGLLLEKIAALTHRAENH
jgi:CheY-like chemotaxis protein